MLELTVKLQELAGGQNAVWVVPAWCKQGKISLHVWWDRGDDSETEGRGVATGGIQGGPMDDWRWCLPPKLLPVVPCPTTAPYGGGENTGKLSTSSEGARGISSEVGGELNDMRCGSR